MNLLDNLHALPSDRSALLTGGGSWQRPRFVRPTRIGQGNSALLGIYQPVHIHQPPVGVLICNPFGQEAIRAQRSLRVVAERLARQAIPSLRFDYFGTGDSPGEDGCGHLTRWRQDILLADVHLRQISGCQRIVWLGLRLGATLALQAASLLGDLPHPHRIILWEPVLDGPAYLNHLARMNEFWTRQSNVTTEALGFLLTTRIRRHIHTIRARRLALPLPDVQLDLLATRTLTGRRDFLGRCSKKRVNLHDHVLQNTVEWTSNTALDSQWVPDEAISTLLEICALSDPAADGLPFPGHTPATPATDLSIQLPSQQSALRPAPHDPPAIAQPQHIPQTTTSTSDPPTARRSSSRLAHPDSLPLG